MKGWKDWIGLGSILLVLALGLGLHHQPAPLFTRTPYLGFGNDTTMGIVISWKTERPVDGVVYYAPQVVYEKGGVFSNSVNVSADSATEDSVYHIALTNLLPDTEYVYKVKLGSGISSTVSDLGRFWTSSSDLNHFVFDVYGDTRTYMQRHMRVVRAMIADHPRFVVHTGDLVETGGVEKLWDDRFFPAISPLAKDAPYLTVLGNHEQNSPLYYESFALPVGGGKAKKEWWSVDYGVVHLVGLDTNILTLPHGFALNREQLNWLKNDLAAARTRGERFIFVFFHHPLFSSDIEYAPGNTGLRQLWHPIFKKYGVTAVFSGHCHSYERLVEDGVNYIVTGGGGAPLGGFADPPIPGSVKRARLLHYMRVTISGDEAKIEMIPVAKVKDGTITELPPKPFDTLMIRSVQTTSQADKS